MTLATARLARAAAAFVLVTTTVAGLAACAPTPDVDPAPRPTAASAATWGACMRAAGIDIPDPSPEMHAKGMHADPGDVDEQAYEEALRTCEDGARGDAESVERHQDAFDEAWEDYAACMAEHGVEGFGTDAGAGPVSDGPADPDWHAASAACGDIVSDFTVRP